MLTLEHKKPTSRGRAATPPVQHHTLPQSASPAVQRAPSCACGGACPRCQAKSTLKVGAPDDAYEREADAVADRVMRMPDGAGPVMAAASGLQRKCPACEMQNEEPLLQIKPETSSASTQGDAATAPSSVVTALRSFGQALDFNTRAFFEPRFGYDFSGVRVHSDAAAEQSAHDVNANAYTVGHNIMFGAGRFAPGTHEGRRLIAHELTHVVQQSGAEGIRAGQSDGKRGLSPVPSGRVSPAGLNKAPGRTVMSTAAIGEVQTSARPASQSTGPGVLQRDDKRTVYTSLHPEETGSFFGSFKLPGGAGLLSYSVELRNVPALLLDQNNRSKLGLECEFGIRTVLQEQLKSGPLPSSMPALHISVDAGYSKAVNRGHVERLVRRAARAELRRAIAQAQKANVARTAVPEPPSFRKSAPVLAELAGAAASTFLPTLEGARDMLVGDDTPTYEEILEEVRRLGINVDQRQAAYQPEPAVEEECNESDSNYGQCLARQRERAYKQGIQAAGVVAEAFLDPTAGPPGGPGALVKLPMKLNRLKKIKEAGSRTTRRHSGYRVPYSVIGPHGKLKGTSVYVLKDADGTVLYVGKGEALNRLREHIKDPKKTQWFGEIAEVEVRATGLDNTRALALEEDLIGQLKPLHNVDQTPFQKEFGNTLALAPNLPKPQRFLKFNLEWGH